MDKFFVIMKSILKNYLNFNCNGKKEHLSTSQYKFFYSQIQRIISDIKISKDEYDYYHIESITKKSKKSLLSDIQNISFQT